MDRMEERYSRQLILKEAGPDGQKKLKDAKVLVIGAGGLGSPVLQYLAGAGVGTLGIADADRVSLSNLHRQVLHPMKNLGNNKAESAAEALHALNPDLTIRIFPHFASPDNISALISPYDFIVDAVDRVETKFLINDACVLAGKPACHAGVVRFHGQVLTVLPGTSPCYRCIFEEIPEDGSVPTAADAGVLGPAVGIIGSIQAAEVLKYLLGCGELLTGRLLLFDALTMQSRIVPFSGPSKHCRICGRTRFPESGAARLRRPTPSPGCDLRE